MGVGGLGARRALVEKQLLHCRLIYCKSSKQQKAVSDRLALNPKTVIPSVNPTPNTEL